MKYLPSPGFFQIGKLFALTLALASVCVLPNVGHAASGTIYMLTSNPEYEVGTRGAAGYLRSLGYTVDVGPGSCDPYLVLNTESNAVQTAKIAQLEAYNLIIIHRNFGSGTLNSGTNSSGVQERALWNNMKVPILNCNGPAIRNNTWRWIDDLYGSTVVPKDLLIEPPGTDAIVNGLSGSLFNANRTYGGVSASFGGGGTDNGGTNMVVLARVDLAGFGNPVCLAVWDEAPGGTELRSFWPGGGETYYRRRVYFELHEYRNNAISPDPWLEVTANGRLLFADAVQYAMYGVVTPPPLVNNLTPADKTANYVPSGGLSFDAASPLPIATSNIVVKLNGSNIAAGLAFSGTTTNRHVAYSGLVSNFLYNVEITVSNATGVRTILAQFDTFVPGQTTSIPTGDYVNYSGSVPAGNYHVYLQIAANTAQVLTFHHGATASSNLQGILNVPNTGFLDPTNYVWVPVTDALGNLNVLRLNGTEDFLIDPVDFLTVLPNDLVVVPAAGVPATLTPILALASPAANAVNVSPLAAIDLTIANRDSSVAPGSIRLKLAGIDVTSAATVTDTSEGATIHYQPSVFLTPSSSYTVTVTLNDNLANSVTNQYSFQTRLMPAIPAAYVTPLGSGSNRGFNIRNHMARNQSGVVFCSTAARAELQLAGLFLNGSGQPITNAITTNQFAAPFTNDTVINYGITNFNGSRGWFTNDDVSIGTNQFSDQKFPGSSALSSTNNIAFEATAYLELKAGINRYGVKSSDGFRLTAGSSLDISNQTVLIGSFDGARGEQVPSEGAFLVYQDGLYAFRLLYFKGGGADVSLEWYSRTNDVEFINDPFAVGDRTLINGTNIDAATPTPAYRQRTSEPIVHPVLSAKLVASTVQISWTSFADFTLQSKINLADPTWLPVGQTPVVVSNLHTVTITSPTGTAYYRLQSP